MSRVFNAHGLRCMTGTPIGIGGVAQVSYSPTYRDVIQSTGDGATGVEDIDRAGLRVGTRVQCSDISKVNGLLAAAESDLNFSGVKSATAPKTYHHVVMKRNLFTGASVSVNKSADGTLNLDGSLRAALATDKLIDLVTITENTTPPTATYPARLYRPNGAVFNDGAAISPKHLQSVELSISANVEEDYGDADLAIIARDIVDWNALQVTLTLRDQTIAAGQNMCSQLLGAGRGTLAVTLLGRNDAAGQQLYVNNLIWTGAPTVTEGRGYWDFSLTGIAGWRSPGGTAYVMNTPGTMLFSIAPT